MKTLIGGTLVLFLASLASAAPQAAAEKEAGTTMQKHRGSKTTGKSNHSKDHSKTSDKHTKDKMQSSSSNR